MIPSLIRKFKALPKYVIYILKFYILFTFYILKSELSKLTNFSPGTVLNYTWGKIQEKRYLIILNEMFKDL